MKEKEAVFFSIVLGVIVLTIVCVVCKGMFIWEVPDAYKEGNKVVSGEAVDSKKNSTDSSIEEKTYIINDSGNTLKTRFDVPDGYKRTKEPVGSLGRFLRHYELKKAGTKVKLYNNQLKDNQNAHAAIFKLPVIKDADIQQCADSVVRVYSEYFRKTKQYRKMCYRLTDGFQAAYSRWIQGYRINVGENSSSWTGGGSAGDTDESYNKFLHLVFSYANTESMVLETRKIKPKNIKIGDLFLEGGSPGHVVMVVDTCENKDGKKAFLLAQGFMPAQQFHVLNNPLHKEDPWYYVDEISYPFETPEYKFKKGSLRRLSYNS